MNRMKKEKRNMFHSISDIRGLTLIEVICAIAIFSMVIAIVGGVLVISSNTYKNGSTETEIQQEAQFAANKISDIIKDSVEVTFLGGAGVQGNYGRLVMNNGARKFVVDLADGGNQLMYGEAEASVEDTAIVPTELLANHITSFLADTSAFEQSHTVRIDMAIEADGREYAMGYNMTARNEEVTTASITPVRTAEIIVESRIILEPGESYDIPVSVMGTTQGVDVESQDDSQVHVSATMDSVRVTLEKTAGESVDVVPIKISTKEKEGVNPLASAIVNVQIRRVKALEVHSELLVGDEGKAGAKYRFITSVTESTPYLAKKALSAWDENYKNPYAVQWNYENQFIVNGTQGVFSDYFKVVEKEEDISSPYLIVELKRDLVVGSSLKVEGVSRHAAIDGGNKSGHAYDTDVKASVLVVGPGLDGAEKAVLEPGESYQTTLPIDECDISTTPELATLNSRGTTVNFVNGEFKIALGKHEIGDSNGKIKIELRAVGDANVENVRTVEIAVRRLNSMRLELKQLTGEGHPVKQPLLARADYQFCTRMTGTNMKKTDGETEEEFLPNPYAVEFSWEFRINGNIVNVTGATGSAIWDIYEYREKTGKYTKVYNDPATNPGNEYFRMIDLGTNNEQPCINFMLRKDFPKNATLKVTARALHPIGKDADGTFTNQTGEAYIEGEMIATATLEGERQEIIDPDDPFDDSEIDYLENFKRGQDFFNFPDAHETANFPGQGVVGCEGRWFIRTREILGADASGNILYGPWTTYRRTIEGSQAKKLNASETRSLLPDKRYQIEMAFMAIDPNTRTVYWPYDTSLTASGSGTGFEGYNNHWDEAIQFTNKETYSSTYNISRAYVVYQVDGNNYKSYGTLDSPVILHPGNWFQINLNGEAIEYGHYQGNCCARVQELVGNTWVEVGNKGWSIQDRSSSLLFKDIRESAKGTYRISFKLVDNGGGTWTKWNGDIWYPVYDNLGPSEYLMCGSNGTAGYVYIKIE